MAAHVAASAASPSPRRPRRAGRAGCPCVGADTVGIVLCILTASWLGPIPADTGRTRRRNAPDAHTPFCPGYHAPVCWRRPETRDLRSLTDASRVRYRAP